MTEIRTRERCKLIVETPTPSWTVYAHISPNGKMYVGITKCKNPNDRWHDGNGYKGQPHFYNAIQKYGWDNFQHKIIASGLTCEEAGKMEQHIIALYDLCNPENGYNHTSGGETSVCGSVANEEARLNYRNAMLQKIANNDGHGLTYGKPCSELHRQRISENHKNNADKYRKHMIGKKWTQEQIEQRMETKRKKYNGKYQGVPSPLAKPIRCIETDEKYESIGDMSRSIGLNTYQIKKIITNQLDFNGLHYEFIDKGEMKHGTGISESQTNPDKN